MARTLKCFMLDKVTSLENLRQRVASLPPGRFWIYPTKDWQWTQGKLPTNDQLVTMYIRLGAIDVEKVYKSRAHILEEYEKMCKAERDRPDRGSNNFNSSHLRYLMFGAGFGPSKMDFGARKPEVE